MMWSFEWTKGIDTEKYEPYVLQFANTERIEQNDVLYIFDETGSGKTVSTGLMVLHYLNNIKDKKVLVLTIPSLVKSGQFLNDWYEKLPFTSADKDRITISNDVYSNINNQSKDWGLIVIDEAHRYLEAPKRREALIKLHSDKIVFMTATPIKRGKYNLDDYCELADAILRVKVDRSWINGIKDGKDALCASFDLKKPVTRYFKDTMVAIRYAEGNKIDYEKKKAIRKLPEIWRYSYTHKIEDMVTKIVEKRNLMDQNRFVIFTRLDDDEAGKIERYLQEHSDQFEEFSGESSAAKITYKKVTGSSATSVGEFSHNGLEKPLPDILIMTYQISEAGVNLPGFNYVINYHIPAYPASLEQRFGRIDRMGEKTGTQYSELHMVFLLSDIGIETNKMNFYNAIWLYRNTIISCIPSRNSVLTSKIIQALQSDKELLGEYYSRLLEMCKNINYPNTELDDVLVDFCRENELMQPEIGNADEFNEFRKMLEETLRARKEEISGLSRPIEDEIILKIINESGDKIFYVTKAEAEKCETGEDISSKITWYDPIKDCAKSIIESDSYTEYEKRFNKLIKEPCEISRVRAKFRNQIEDFFERQFCVEVSDSVKEMECWKKNPILIGNYQNIFVYDYKELFRNNWSVITDDEKDKDAFLGFCCDAYNIRGWLDELPFFIMCRKFGEYLYDECFCRNPENGKGLWFRERFEGNPLVYAYIELRKNNYIPDYIKNKCEEVEDKKELFTTYWFFSQKNNIFFCSSWLVLAFISFENIDYPDIIEYILRNIDNKYESLIFQSRDEFPKWWKNGRDLCYGRDSFCDMILTKDFDYKIGFRWREYVKKTPSTTYLLPYYKYGNGYRNWTLNEAEDDGCKVLDIWTYIILKLLMEESYGSGKFRYIYYTEEYKSDCYRGNLDFVVNDLLLLLKENSEAPYPFPGHVLPIS